MSEYQCFLILKTITGEANSQHYNCAIMFTSHIQTIKKKKPKIAETCKNSPVQCLKMQ